MSPEYERLRDAALALPREERLRVLMVLLRSLDGEDLEGLDDELAEPPGVDAEA